MNATPLDLFGTDEPPPERRRLRAGPLSVVLENGNLRDIRFGNVEVVRAINYLARDAAWGTYKPTISNLRIVQGESAFEVDYVGHCGEPETGFSYAMHIRGDAAGALRMEADGVALSDFPTNRTGFVILHAAEAAGGKMSLVHSDGRPEDLAFPLLTSADQPAFDIRAITHQPAPGLSCTIEMEGDAFEMEDQRNWGDASFKTYVRPLSRPRPYVIAKGTSDRQVVSVRLEGRAPDLAGVDQADGRIAIGEASGQMPAMALFVDDAGTGALAVAPQFLVVRLDPEQAGSVASLSGVAAIASMGASSLAVELVLSARDPQAEATNALRVIDAAGLAPTVLLVSPRREFKSRASHTLPTGEVEIDALVNALKKSGFTGLIGAGTPSYFTEFNRNPPGIAADFVYFSVAAIVHAADDVSVAETVEVFPMLVASARALCPGRRVWLGPCTIGVRHNPYGSATQDNPANGRVPSATIDPRQRALFGAAYAVAAVAQATGCGVDCVTLGATAGPFGIAEADGRPRPIGAIVAELGSAFAANSHVLRSGAAGVHGIAWTGANGMRALIANLTAEPASLRLPTGLSRASVLQPDSRWSPVVVRSDRLDLHPYRTALLTA